MAENSAAKRKCGFHKLYLLVIMYWNMYKYCFGISGKIMLCNKNKWSYVYAYLVVQFGQSFITN